MEESAKLLGQVREEIDQIDAQLLPLLLKRMACSGEVARIKTAHSLPVFNSEREKAILDSVRARAGELGDAAVELYTAIMAVSREYQYGLMPRNGALTELVKTAPHQVTLENKKISALILQIF